MSRYGSAIVAAGFGLVVLAGAAACSSSGGANAAGSAPGAAVQTTDPAGDDYSYPPQATFGPGDDVTVETGAASPPAGGGSYVDTAAIELVLQQGGAPCTGGAPEDPSSLEAVSLTSCASPDATVTTDVEIAVFGKHSDVVDYASANFILGDATDTVVLGGANWAIQAPADYAAAAERVLGGTLYTADPEASPSHTGPPAPEQVTYHCTGHAPEGVDITYGPSGSQHSASRLPFTRTEKLDDSAQYYVTVAQLQGGGSVSCTTTVQTDNLDGSADVVSNSGSADGGYTIARAQVCSLFDGEWEKC